MQRVAKDNEGEDKKTGILSESVAVLMTGESVVTCPIKQELERRWYAPRVRKFLGMTDDEFESIDWQAHSEAIRKVGGTSLRKLLWCQHPTRVKQKKTGQHDSDLCPLCDEVDDTSHFMRCKPVNESGRYKQLRDEYRHRVKKIGAPDHLINHISNLMNGIELSPRRYP